LQTRQCNNVAYEQKQTITQTTLRALLNVDIAVLVNPFQDGATLQ